RRRRTETAHWSTGRAWQGPDPDPARTLDRPAVKEGGEAAAFSSTVHRRGRRRSASVAPVHPRSHRPRPPESNSHAVTLGTPRPERHYFLSCGARVNAHRSSGRASPPGPGCHLSIKERCRALALMSASCMLVLAASKL